MNKELDHYGGYSARQMSLEKLKVIFSELGARKILVKQLAPNDNSKNQLYLGPDFSALNLIPTGEIRAFQSASKKKTGGADKTIFRAPVKLIWVDPEGQLHPSENTKLILYPQYPEIRMSGFLQGSSIKISEWMDPYKHGRAEGRFLILGIRGNDTVYAYLATPVTALSAHLAQIDKSALEGVFFCLPIIHRRTYQKTEDMFDSVADAAQIHYESFTKEFTNTRDELLDTLRLIHEKGWLNSRRLDSDGNTLPCNAPNCGGYTLEAELGVTPNGYAEPDYLGWEIKQFGVTDFSKIDAKVVTLMTPEPTGGVYKEEGVQKFLQDYGYSDQKGRADRINFGGIHKCGLKQRLTKLTLLLDGFDSQTNKIVDASGGIILISEEDTIAAKWDFSGLLEHWKRKHNQAVYVPSMNMKEPERKYRYGNFVKLGEGTDVTHLLSSISSGVVYYDPGIKMEKASTSNPRIKKRSQFRIKTRNLSELYRKMHLINLLES